jgi:hypothetical protein
VKKSVYIASVFALVVGAWGLGTAGAAPRCYPSKRFKFTLTEVTDNLTGLVWQRQVSATTMEWAAAQTYCPTGFRLPTVKELVSITDLTVPLPGPTIDQTAFPNTPAETFWTSTVEPGPAGEVYLVSFQQGVHWAGPLAKNRVRCVR